MKKKYIAILLGITLGMTTLVGCSGTNTSESSTIQESQSVTGATENSDKRVSEAETADVYGEVTAVSEDSITIKVGTMKQREKPDDAGAPGDSSNAQSSDDKTDSDSTEKGSESTDSSENKSDNSSDSQNAQLPENIEKPDGDGQGAPSMLDLTDEEKEIKITDDTVIVRSSRGGMAGGPQGNGGAPPEKPESSSDSSDSSDSPDNNNSQPPEMPDNSGNGGAPDMQQKTEESSLSDISEGDTVAITYDEDGNTAKITVISMEMGGGMGQPGGGPGSSQGVDSYDAVNAYTSDNEVDGETIASTGTDENAVNVSEGASVTLKDVTITRDSSESTGGDNSSFYGVGAAVLATDGNAYVKGGTVTTDAAGGAGLFAYNNGTVYAADTKITTKQDTSGGIHAAGGGTFYAWDLDVETNGESSAAIRSDRGGGKMVVDGGTYTSNGTGSPAIYSTADIAVNEATLAANGSEAICIEGLNSIHLYDSDLTGNMSDDSRNDCTWNVILYQSMSGDSEVGNSIFEMDGGSLTAKNGGMFYTTNTESTITLDDVDITNAEDSEFFLKCTGNANQRGWGTTGANGADCLFTAIDQTMEGNVIWDSISDLDFYMTGESTLTGAVVQDEGNAGGGGDGYCNLYIGEDATWIVTGDSIVSALHCAGTIEDNEGKTVTVKGTDGTVYVKGDGSYTITVTSYEDSADLSGASTTTSWSAYETEKPAELE